ncbi:hypothetical protein BCU91_13490 [Shewanella sp. 10N.286.52.B9]|nr:hypothetical protein BCU91_13490 [Shewanella sp. 10N.286.52.B9]
MQLSEAGSKYRLKLDDSPLEILLFKFRRSGEGDARGSCRPLPFALVWAKRHDVELNPNEVWKLSNQIWILVYLI